MRSVLLLLALCGGLAIAYAILVRRRRLQERREVARILRALADGTLERYAWHDFLAMPISDPGLAEIRAHVASLARRHPPSEPGALCGEAGIAVIERYADRLQGSGGGRSRPCHSGSGRRTTSGR